MRSLILSCTGSKKPPRSTRKAEPAPIVIKNTDALVEILEGTDALSAAEELVAQAEETYFNLGGVLAHIYHEGLYKGAGFDGPSGFADYTKARLNTDYRKVTLQPVANRRSRAWTFGGVSHARQRLLRT